MFFAEFSKVHTVADFLLRCGFIAVFNDAKTMLGLNLLLNYSFQ